MKVPDNLVYSIFQFQDERIKRELIRKTIEISTGKRIHDLSDDPPATFNVMNLKKDIAQLSQFSKNRLFADVNLTYIDFTLGKISDRLKELYTKTAQAKNQIHTPDALASMGKEFEDALSFLLNMANEKVGENYIFSGTALTTKPFDDNFNYLGSQEVFSVQMGEDSFAEVFQPGDRVFTTNVLELDVSYSSPDDTLSIGGDGSAELVIDYKGNTYSITYDNDTSTSAPSTLNELANAINSASGGEFQAFVHQKEDGTYTLRLVPSEAGQEITVSYANAASPSEELGDFNQLSVFRIVNRIKDKLKAGLSPDDSDLASVQRSYEKIVYERSESGSVLSQVRAIQEPQENRMDVLKKQKSDNEEVNLSESIMEYTRYRLAYEALMKIVADTRDLTILKYI